MSERARHMIPEVGKVYSIVLGVVGAVSVDWSKILSLDWSKITTPIETLLKIVLILVTIAWTYTKWRNEKKKSSSDE